MKPWIPLLALGLALSPLAVLHPLRVQGRSMEPTLRNGRLCWVLRSWVAGEPRRGQVWLVEGPEGPSLKRVLALPGECLEMRDGDLFRQGARLEEPYVARIERGDAGPWEAGRGYLVLGDNRPLSRDSRAWGSLDESAFRGRVLGQEEAVLR